MSKETFWTIVGGWSVCVVVMCVWLYRSAKGQDKEEDHSEAIRDDIEFDWRKRYGYPVPPILNQAERWQQNARVAESADDFWDSGDAA